MAKIILKGDKDKVIVVDKELAESIAKMHDEYLQDGKRQTVDINGRRVSIAKIDEIYVTDASPAEMPKYRYDLMNDNDRRRVLEFGQMLEDLEKQKLPHQPTWYGDPVKQRRIFGPPLTDEQFAKYKDWVFTDTQIHFCHASVIQYLISQRILERTVVSWTTKAGQKLDRVVYRSFSEGYVFENGKRRMVPGMDDFVEKWKALKAITSQRRRMSQEDQRRLNSMVESAKDHVVPKISNDDFIPFPS